MSSLKRKRLKPGERVALSLTLAQVDFIVEHTLLGEGLLATIHAARVRDEVVCARFTLGELEELAGYVEATTKDTKNRDNQKALDAIAEAIAKVEQAYYYGLSPNRTSERLKLVRIENG